MRDIRFSIQQEQAQAAIKLMEQLAKGEKSGKEKGWLSIDDVEENLGCCEP